jgi:hypothetical protein
MNTLELWPICAFVLVILCLRTARKWAVREQAWTVLDWLTAIYYVYSLIVSIALLLDNLAHPAHIQTLPVCISWALWFFIALAMLGFLVRFTATMGRRLRHLER